MKNLILYIALAGFLWSCTVSKPVAPPTTYQEVKFQQKLSTLSVPVDIPVAKISDKINTSLSGVIFEDNDYNDNGGDNLLVKVTKLQNIALNAQGEFISYSVPLKIWVKTKVGILGMDTYHEADLGIKLNFKSKISVASNWKVQTQTVADGYEWISEPVINVAGSVDIPVKFLADIILKTQQNRLAGIIDQSVSHNLNIKPYIENAWNQVQVPIETSSEPNAWIKLSPQELSMSPLSAAGGKIRAFIGITTYAQTYIGTKPAETAKIALPALKSAPGTNNDFNISILANISYSDATEMVKKQLVGQVFEFNNDKKKVTINDISLYPSTGKLISKVTVTGSLTGIIYLSCIPYYDAATQSIKVKNVEYDIDTKNKLARSASWILQGTIEKQILKHGVFPLQNQLANARKMAQDNLTNKEISKGVHINGKLQSLEPEQIILTEEAISAVIDAKGQIDLLVDGLDF